MRTLQELAQETIAVQDACNLTGVVHGMSRAMTNLRELFPGEGTDFFNHHPISRMWADKIYSLTNGLDIGGDERSAYEWCKEIVGDE